MRHRMEATVRSTSLMPDFASAFSGAFAASDSTAFGAADGYDGGMRAVCGIVRGSSFAAGFIAGCMYCGFMAGYWGTAE